jgi:hypothetical protein
MVPIEPVLRKYWNEDAGMPRFYSNQPFSCCESKGLEFVSQLCVQDEERAATIVAVSRKCAYMRISRHLTHPCVLLSDTMPCLLPPQYSNTQKSS